MPHESYFGPTVTAAIMDGLLHFRRAAQARHSREHRCHKKAADCRNVGWVLAPTRQFLITARTSPRRPQRVQRNYLPFSLKSRVRQGLLALGGMPTPLLRGHVLSRPRACAPWQLAMVPAALRRTLLPASGPASRILDLTSYQEAW
jgi:hypothetical protein